MASVDSNVKENGDASRVATTKRKSEATEAAQPPSKKPLGASAQPKLTSSASKVPARITAPTASSRSSASATSLVAKPAVPKGPTVSAATARKAAAAITSTSVSGPGRRPGWDLKGRLEDMESNYTSMADQVRDNNSKFQSLLAQLAEKESTVNSLASTKKALMENLQSQQADYERAAADQQRLMDTIAQLRRDHQTELEGCQSKIRSLELERDQVRLRVSMLNEEVGRTKLQLEENQLKLSQTEAALASTRNELQAARDLAEQRNRRIDELLSKISGLEETVKGLESKTREDERMRRKLHNTIQELKGNIRVFCRVRPMSSKEKEAGWTSPYAFTDERSVEITGAAEKSALGKQDAKRKWQFSFDKVFQPTASQTDVFNEVSQLVQSSLDGYNTCIFAYGQTGSGKTFTMEGPEEPDEYTKGVIPRAVEQVFASAKELEERNWVFEMEADFLEIYNETIQDLLSSTPAAAEHKIIHEGQNTTVTGITVQKVTRPAQVYELLKRAAKNRSVGSTKMNERSSRSHSLFQLRISGKNTVTNENIKGMLNLIDLAGSERLDQSGATGDRLTETKAINKSLSTLAKVIFALASKDSHIPYRDSKLTYLLQNSLGGNSKTLMFVNVSPLDRDCNETLNSLRFATQVNACEIGTAKKQGNKKLEM